MADVFILEEERRPSLSHPHNLNTYFNSPEDYLMQWSTNDDSTKADADYLESTAVCADK